MSQTDRTAAVSPSFNFLMILLTFTGAGLAIQFGIGGEKGLAVVFVLAGWMLALCLHEFGHAYIAWKGGDHTIAGTGYLTLDPVHYVHPVFSILLPVLFTLLGGIGFPGGAVYIKDGLLRTKAWQSAVSFAGPAMDMLFLVAVLLLYQLTAQADETLRFVLGILALYVSTSIVLNLIPIPGLDGYGILRPWLPDVIRNPADEIAQHSGLILTGLFLFSGAFSRMLFGAGLEILSTFDVSPSDVFAGYRLMRLW